MYFWFEYAIAANIDTHVHCICIFWLLLCFLKNAIGIADSLANNIAIITWRCFWGVSCRSILFII